jgi:RNA recognition motif-containing protein
MEFTFNVSLAVNIIVRNNRSLGYGFVSYKTEAEAQKAVELMDKKELDGRTINVEVAKPKVAGGEPRKRRSRKNIRRGSARKSAASGESEGEATDNDANTPADASGAATPRRRRIRRRGPKKAPKEGEAESTTEAARIDQDGEEPATDGVDQQKSNRRRPRRRNNRKTSGNASGTEGAAAEAGEASATESKKDGRRNRRRGSKTPKPAAEGPLSKTTLFVANLPFKVDNEKLAAIFKDFSVKNAKVVTLRNGRSKGFGFVEVKDEKEQGRVLQELQNVQVDGRELIIKVALASSEAGASDAAEATA